MPTSFISERSAEMLLVAELMSLIRDVYPSVTPLFYWSTREGNNLSRQSFHGKTLKIVVLYARRPKVEYIGSGEIEIKLNELLFRRSDLYSHSGMPVIAGCPLADKLEELVMGVPCIWLKLMLGGNTEVITVNVTDPVIQAENAVIITRDDILRMIATSNDFTWARAIDVINSVRRETLMDDDGAFRFGMYGDIYKPVYLLIHDKHDHSSKG